MPLWTPTAEWTGRAAYLIGGGSSLAGFDFTKLANECVIGCNDAYHLGAGVVKVCVFGDASWFAKNRPGLQTYSSQGGRVITNAPALLRDTTPWLSQAVRLERGLGQGSQLGWNYSTGAIAINVALTLGANQIYLLGYDLCAREGRSQWHNYPRPRVTPPATFSRFTRGFARVAAELAGLYSNVKVINVTDGSSQLDCFPKISFADAFPVRDCRAQPVETVNLALSSGTVCQNASEEGSRA